MYSFENSSIMQFVLSVFMILKTSFLRIILNNKDIFLTLKRYLNQRVEIKMKAKFKDGHLQVTQVLLVIKINHTVYKKWSHIAMIRVWNIGL